MSTISSKIDMSGFDRYERLMPQVLADAQAEALDEAAQIMRDTVAVDTGLTRSTIMRDGDAVTVGGAGLYLEFGTVHQAAQPFMIPAFHQVVDGLAARLKRKAAQHGLG